MSGRLCRDRGAKLTALGAGYMGHTSGAAFYSRVSLLIPSLEPLATLVTPPLPPNVYHTKDGAPMPVLHENPYELPSRAVANHLGAVFYHHTCDLYWWMADSELERIVAEVYDAQTGDVELWKLCTVNVVLALGAQFAGEASGSHEYQTPGGQFFARAKVLLLSIWEDVSLMTIRLLALMVGRMTWRFRL